jgi:CRP/FNR family transcriptional regulator, cyclic AMP receptor protein
MGTTVQSSCVTCDFRPDRFFCDMPSASLKAFDEIKSLASYRRNTVLFAEGRPVRGIYILCDGRAKLSICSDTGKRLTLRIAGPGEVLGMGAALSNSPYEITAELLDNSQVVFIRRKELLKFLRDHPGICLQVVNMLSQELHGAYERVRNISTGHCRHGRISFRLRPMVV